MTRIGSILVTAFALLSRVVRRRMGKRRPRPAIEHRAPYAWIERYDEGWIVRRSDGLCWSIEGWTPLELYVFASDVDARAMLDLLADAGRVIKAR